MPAAYEIIKDIHLVVILCSGQPDPDEFIDMIKQLYADPGYLLSYNVLIDVRERTGAISTEEINRIDAHLKTYKGDNTAKRAFLVSRTADYGMVRVYEAVRDAKSNVDIAAFMDREEALSWLGLQGCPLFVSGKYSK